MWFWPKRKPRRPRSLREQLEEARDALRKAEEGATGFGSITHVHYGSPKVQVRLQLQLREVEEALARLDRSHGKRS